MCLSTVYKNEHFLCKNIAKVEVVGDKLVFTDIMGVKTTFIGVISNIDLLENTIHISAEEVI